MRAKSARHSTDPRTFCETARRRDSTGGTSDVRVSPVPRPWSADDAKDALWAVIRLLEAPPVYRVSLVEVEVAAL